MPTSPTHLSYPVSLTVNNRYLFIEDNWGSSVLQKISWLIYSFFPNGHMPREMNLILLQEGKASKSYHREKKQGRMSLASLHVTSLGQSPCLVMSSTGQLCQSWVTACWRPMGPASSLTSSNNIMELFAGIRHKGRSRLAYWLSALDGTAVVGSPDFWYRGQVNGLLTLFSEP